MNDGEFICFVEEKSAREILEFLVPQIADIEPERVRCFDLNGKENLLKRIRDMLRGYRRPNCVFLVMCDQDKGECEELKQELLNKLPKDRLDRVKVRIACRELESFYLGDQSAVSKAYPTANFDKGRGKVNYTMPDEMPNKNIKPSEVMKLITNREYQKVLGSRTIAPYLNLDGSNKSASFNHLIKAIRYLSDTLKSHGAH